MKLQIAAFSDSDILIILPNTCYTERNMRVWEVIDGKFESPSKYFQEH